jgi:U4/U6.U5 tri-snRNP-associated protein 2
MLQAAVLCSEKRFQITKQSRCFMINLVLNSNVCIGDAADFMNWLLNTLHVALNGTTKTSSSIIYKIFRGRMRQYTRKVLPVDASEEARATLLETEEFKGKYRQMYGVKQ